MEKRELLWNVVKGKCHAEFISASPKKLQYGRSMIEMIGVLAIIGVISIGGVWGLNKAMTKNTTNNLIEDVKLAGFVVVSELFDTLPDVDEETGLNLAGKFAQNSPYTFKAFPEGETTFEIFVPDVSYNVCMELKQRKVDWLEEIKANGIPNTCNENELNDISFFFNIHLNSKPEVEGKECRTNADCSGETPFCFNGYCGKCRLNSDCPSTHPYCKNGYCTTCQTGLQTTGGECTSCPENGTQYTSTTADACHSCGRYFFLGSANFCSGCKAEGDSSLKPSRNECKRCPNRCWDEAQSRCFPSIEGNSFNNNGVCNYDCPSGQFAGRLSNTYQCISCARTNGSPYPITTQDHCQHCTNRYYNTEQNRCLLCPSGKKASDDGLSCIDL